MSAYRREDALSYLLGRLDDVRRNRDGWSAPCPVPQCSYRLSIGVGREGRVLVHCPAGCDVRTITSVLGLSVRDLFASPRRRGEGHQ